MTKLNILAIQELLQFAFFTFCVNKVITFCVGKLLHFALIILLHFALILLHFVLVLHFAAIVITFCVSITLCGDYYILRRNNVKEESYQNSNKRPYDCIRTRSAVTEPLNNPEMFTSFVLGFVIGITQVKI